MIIIITGCLYREVQAASGLDIAKVKEMLHEHMKDEGFLTEIDETNSTFTIVG